MTLTLDLPPDLEAALQNAAAREGVAPETFLLETLSEKVRRAAAPSLPAREATLLQEINLGLRPETWERLHELKARRQAESLTLDEQSELIRLSDEAEAWTVQRLSMLMELAGLRGLPVADLMRELGLAAPLDA